MKNYLKTTAIAAALAVGFVGPAMADVEVVGEVNKEKEVIINVTTDKTKLVDVDVTFDGETTGSAQGMATVNATIVDSSVGSYQGELFTGDPNDMDLERSVSIDESLNRNTGIVQFNQDAGNISNQGNVAALSIVLGGEDDSESTVAEAYVDQKVKRSSVVHREGADNLPDDLENGPFEPDFAATIAGSILGNTGVVHANQNNGSMNNQHNMLTAAVGTNAVVALSDAGLGQEISGNFLVDINTIKKASITGSVNNNTGIVNVNQATGTMNNQATIVSVAALASSVGLGN